MPTWNELVQLPDADLGKLDLAAVHLACAEGLPGAEGLNTLRCLQQLDAIARQVRQTTERLTPQFHRKPAHFNHSEAYFRMLCLVSVLQRDVGVYTVPTLNDDRDFSNAEDLFLHSVLRGKGGNCSTLPVLYAAVGRRLGYPLRLARTARHLFARWEDPGGERFNIECTVRGLDTPSDAYYLSWPQRVPPEEVRAGSFLKTLSPREELAGFLIQRAYCLFDNKRHREAVESCIGACIAAPHNKLHERSTVDMMRVWRAKLWRLVPPLFPKILICPSTTRHFPARIPYEVEREIITLGVLQDLLEDAENERRWWRYLRESMGGWPPHIPTRIEIGTQPRNPFGPERINL